MWDIFVLQHKEFPVTQHFHTKSGPRFCYVMFTKVAKDRNEENNMSGKNGNLCDSFPPAIYARWLCML